MTLTFTDEQIDLIRSSMCNSAMKHLVKAFEIEEELKKLGRDDRDAVEWEMNTRETCHQVIEIIDKAREM